MKKASFIFSIFFNFNTIFFSQSNSPVGTWILKEHVVFSASVKNVFNNDFVSKIVFDTNGIYTHFIQDSVVENGRWFLKNGGRKLVVKYDGFGIYSQKNEAPINFNKGLYINEEYMQLYDNSIDSSFGGSSKYVRIPVIKIDSSLLIGTWKVNEIKIGKKKESYIGYWSFEFSFDSTKAKQYVEKWIWNGPNDDLLMLDDKFQPFCNDFFIDSAMPESIVFLSTRKKKKVLTYLVKMK